MARKPRVGPGWSGSPPQDAQPPTNSDTLSASPANLADSVSVLNLTNSVSEPDPAVPKLPLNAAQKDSDKVASFATDTFYSKSVDLNTKGKSHSCRRDS